MKSGEYGKMYYNFDRDKTIFIYDDSQTVDSSRFTIAHELGHYFLNHKDVLDRGDRDFEKEADLFSTYLLMKGVK